MLMTCLKRWKGNAFLLVPVIAGLLLTGGFPVAPAGAQVILPPGAAAPVGPQSLTQVPIPEPTNLYAFLRGNPLGTPAEQTEAAQAKLAAIALGKALFWDMQVGSDNTQACATCHFNAGADSRSKNQLSPGLAGGDTIFGNVSPFVPFFTDAGIAGHPNFGPNVAVAAADFPFHERTPRTDPVPRLLPDLTLALPADEFATVVRDTNDVMSSQGVKMNDNSTNEDDIFNWNTNRNATRGTTFDQRRVEPRNAPSMINRVFNLDMFWDGRASFVFNGKNPFGFRDRTSTVERHVGGGTIENVIVRIPFGGHASQAVGPPLSDFEMSGIIRSFADLGGKLLDPTLVPLDLQVVHPNDSVLGPYANAIFVLNKKDQPTGKVSTDTGLNTSYQAMIEAAFKPEWWNGSAVQMENNFSLFFGLAVQLYQATLIANDTPFDRVQNGDPSLWDATLQQGLEIFANPLNPAFGLCINCHVLPETTNNAVRLLINPITVVGQPTDLVNVVVPNLIVEAMAFGNFVPLPAGTQPGDINFNDPAILAGIGLYDSGFYNIGVRPTNEDLGRFGKAPPTLEFDPVGLPLSYVELALMKRGGLLPADVDQFVPVIPPTLPVDIPLQDGTFLLAVPVPTANLPAVTQGAFKVPNLRNQEFQGPYFHNGGDATLRHVVEFYTRGGNFPATNAAALDPDIGPILGLQTLAPGDAGDLNIQALVEFLSRGLNDQRVANEAAPFDHPQLFIPEGATGKDPDLDKMTEIKATGAAGAGAIPTFLGLDPQAP